MTTVELAWLAGLLEGEAAFYATTARGKRYPAIRLAMCDQDVVERAAALMGRRSRRWSPPSHRALGRTPQHVVYLTGRAAIDLMTALRPHMGFRRGAKIDALIADAPYQEVSAA